MWIFPAAWSICGRWGRSKRHHKLWVDSQVWEQKFKINMYKSVKIGMKSLRRIPQKRLLMAIKEKFSGVKIHAYE